MTANGHENENLPTKSQFLFYTTEDGKKRIEVRLEKGSVWLTQKVMADLFQVGVNTINHHIKGVYSDDELLPEATIRKYRIVQNEGKRQITRNVDFYNLEMIIAEMAKQVAHAGYEKFSENRRFVEADQADDELKQTIRRLTEGKRGDQQNG